MSTLTIRDFDDDLTAELRVRAARHGRSVEAEALEIIKTSLATEEAEVGLGTLIHERFAELGGVDLPLPPRTDPPRAVELDDEDSPE